MEPCCASAAEIPPSRRPVSFSERWLFPLGLAFLFLLTFDAASRRYAQDFLPQLMILAFAGAGALAAAHRWDRWRPAAWPVLCFSTLLHLHLGLFEFVDSTFPDPNAMKAFVAISPALDRLAPGPRLIEQEAITHNDLGVIAMRQRRFPAGARPLRAGRDAHAALPAALRRTSA